ncbi:MAG: ATP-binding protein, partial [Methylococcaceae bacterium]|nr:ATP-binding protein [Methylococcaceae bacterium]
MSASVLEANARDLEQELAWFAQVLDRRFAHYLGEQGKDAPFELPPAPRYEDSPSPYAHFLGYYPFTDAERVALVLGLVPHVRPQLLDVFLLKNKTFDRRFTEFGGIRHGADGDFVPTGETLLFLLAGTDLAIRFAAQALFERDHVFARHDILRLAPENDEPPLKAPLRLSEEYLAYFTTGQAHRPDFGVKFPARFIETELEWDDLVLHPSTRSQIGEIEAWLEHGDTLMNDWGLGPKLRPGYRALFYGPPGTGKTMTACLLGKATGRDVYKVDLSLVVSKYIGETEKNLARVFDQAEHRNWILFFDEADALFGKRSETKDAHDRYANQEIAFLLQRLESFDSVAILATNLRDNLDDAFARRFESIVYFPLPRPEERLSLWRRSFPAKAGLDQAIDLEKLAREHELSGGAIMNVVRYAALQTLQRDRTTIAVEDVREGIRREYGKERK